MISPTAPLGAALHRRSGGRHRRVRGTQRRAAGARPRGRSGLTEPTPISVGDDVAPLVDDLGEVDDVAVPPRLPPGREIELPAGTVLLRELPGPPGAPTVVLLHGWTATADLNFFTSYFPLGERFRVLAFDHRGHGHGIRSRRVFRLEDCADDVAAMADLRRHRPVIARRLLDGRRRRPAPVAAPPRTGARARAVATASHFNAARNERLSFLGLTGLAALARLTPAQARTWLTDQLYLQRKTSSWAPWAAEQASRNDWRMVLEAGRAIGAFRSDEWLGEVDVPTAVVVTMLDQVVPVRRQIKLFEAIPTAQALRIDAAHDGIVARPDRAVPVIVRRVRGGRPR